MRHPARMKVVLVAEHGLAADRRGVRATNESEMPSGPSTSVVERPLDVGAGRLLDQPADQEIAAVRIGPALPRLEQQRRGIDMREQAVFAPRIVVPFDRGLVVVALGVARQSAGVLQKLPQREAAARHRSGRDRAGRRRPAPARRPQSRSWRCSTTAPAPTRSPATLSPTQDAIRGARTAISALVQPGADALDRLLHIGGRAGVAEAHEMPAVDRIEIDAGRRRHMRLLQQPLGEIEAVVGESRDVGVEIERAVDRQEFRRAPPSAILRSGFSGCPRSRA